MKIVLTGATGNTGGYALKRLLSFPSVTSVIVLTRRPLSDAVTSPKITNIILTDEEFITYPPHVVKAIEGASGGVWTLGALPKNTPEGIKEAKKIMIDYTYALLKAVVSNPPLKSGEPFRFAFTSGGLIPEDPNASMWMLSGIRKTAAETMIEFHNFAAENSSKLQITICKPWYIRSPDAGLGVISLFPSYYIPVNVLAAALVDIAMNGSKEKNLRNVALKEKGLAALKACP